MPVRVTVEGQIDGARHAHDGRRILVLSDGRIAEEGTHDELLSLRGVYFDLYSRQMLSRELEASS